MRITDASCCCLVSHQLHTMLCVQYILCCVYSTYYAVCTLHTMLCVHYILCFVYITYYAVCTVHTMLCVQYFLLTFDVAKYNLLYWTARRCTMALHFILTTASDCGFVEWKHWIVWLILKWWINLQFINLFAEIT